MQSTDKVSMRTNHESMRIFIDTFYARVYYVFRYSANAISKYSI